jgi:uncharacterized protein YndB with AHSA1/START domain
VADIYQDFPINAPVAHVYTAISTPRGLDTWWTKTSAGQPVVGAEFELGFGPGYDWRAKVTARVPDSVFELQMIQADSDWTGTQIGFRLTARADATGVQFYHTGWPAQNEHWRISCHCWAMYLRILRRSLEYGEQVPYDRRLDV